MRYFWLLDQATQIYFKLYYHPREELMADYPTKANTGPLNTHVCSFYSHMDTSPICLIQAAMPNAGQGCAVIQGDPYNTGISLPRILNYNVPAWAAAASGVQGTRLIYRTPELDGIKQTSIHASITNYMSAISYDGQTSNLPTSTVCTHIPVYYTQLLATEGTPRDDWA
jgi:hypothetical protein